MTSGTKTTVALHTLGCRLNQAETAAIEHSLISQGYEVVADSTPCDVAVINTCTVTEGGDADTRRLVNRVSRLNPSVRIALIGCQAQMQKEQLATLPNVRWIVGNERKMDLANVFQEYPNPQTAQVITPTIERVAFTQPIAAFDSQHTRANIKIQDGCDFFCSFCEIPYARGRARSRVFDDILLEANALVKGGHKELVLTGINIGTYAYEGKTMMDVVEALEAIEGLERIRISSIEPTTIPFDLIARMGQGKLCRYLHIPLQSGNDVILEAMKRKYTTQQFLDFITRAVNQVKHICVGTDVIVGFPGETDAQFEATCDFLREAPIHYFHVFTYSPRSMNHSRHLPPVHSATVSRRSQTLRELSQRKRRMYFESLLGTTERVLFEEFKNGYWTGLTDHYVRVIVESNEPLTNAMQMVRLQSVQGQAIKGECL